MTRLAPGREQEIREQHERFGHDEIPADLSWPCSTCDLLAELDALRADLAAAVKVTEAARAWRLAYEATGRCRDEFGWNEEGTNACGQWQEEEDAAAAALEAALAACPVPTSEGGNR